MKDTQTRLFIGGKFDYRGANCWDSKEGTVIFGRFLMEKYQSLIKCHSCLAKMTAMAAVGRRTSAISVKKPLTPIQLLPKFSESAAE